MYRPGRDGGAGPVAAAAAAGAPSPMLVRWPAAGGGAAVAKVVSSVATGTSLIGTGAPEGTAPAALHLAAHKSLCVKVCEVKKNYRRKKRRMIEGTRKNITQFNYHQRNSCVT